MSEELGLEALLGWGVALCPTMDDLVLIPLVILAFKSDDLLFQTVNNQDYLYTDFPMIVLSSSLFSQRIYILQVLGYVWKKFFFFNFLKIGINNGNLAISYYTIMFKSKQIK